MALPLGKVGIAEIPNESAVLKAMQSGISDKTGSIFPRSRRWQERNELGKEQGDEGDAAKNSREPIRAVSCISRPCVSRQLRP